MIKKVLYHYIIILLLSLAVVVNAVAAGGLVVGGATLEKEIPAGGGYLHVINVSLDQSGADADVEITVEGLGQKSDGVCQALPAGIDLSPHTARNFLIIDRNAFHLESGEAQKINVSVNVPIGAATGGKYAAIRITTVPPGGGGVKTTSGIVVPVLLTVHNGEPVPGLFKEGQITALTVSGAQSGEVVNVTTTFKNTGNYHFKIKGEVDVYTLGGVKQASLAIPLTASSLIPTMSRQLSASYAPAGGLPQGSYYVVSKVMLEDGTVLDEATAGFTVTSATAPSPGGGYIPYVQTPSANAADPGLPHTGFQDTSGHWAHEDIGFMTGLGIVRGFSDGRFYPEKKATRAQFAAFLIRSLGIKEVLPANPHFKDVSPEAWYYGAIEAVLKADLMKGYPDGSFRAEAYITREEIAAIVSRVVTRNNGMMISKGSLTLDQFTDTGRICAWAGDAVATAVQYGLVVGRADGKFAPHEHATRAEAVVILKRMLLSLGKLTA
jgi:hypothetical protein